MDSQVISKILSANDTGDTGGHQAGIVVPRKPDILSFFPPLDISEKNPRHHLAFYDDSDFRWEFAFIYYNNKYFGGTRNEYRLTRMTPFLRQNNLKPGDEVILKRDEDGKRHIRYKRKHDGGMGKDGVFKAWLKLEGYKPVGGDVMAEEIEVLPDPTRLIEGLRDTGYEFNTAIADIIDNSIAAEATVVDLKIVMDLHGDVCVSIADNGCGMGLEELINAMKYGSERRPNPASLGKFGLGLKTASTAFCRRLSVVSQNKVDDSPTEATWDLDHVAESGKWELLISDNPARETVEHLRSITEGPGTVVIWGNIDRLMKSYKDRGGTHAQKALRKIIQGLKEHIAMIFQRYLDNSDDRASNLEILINDEPIQPWDPFCTEHSDLVGDQNVPVGLEEEKEVPFHVRAYILPRKEEFPDEESFRNAKLGNERQGIYIYRENRLIHHANWLGMYSKEPHGSLLRVEFSFDHRLDEAFRIDIKKSQIILNEELWNWLKDEFLTAPRREADRRYRQGVKRTIAEGTAGSHDSSNKNIASKEGEVNKANVNVVNPDTGDCEVSNKHGQVTLKINVGESLRPGEKFVQPVDGLDENILFEPAIIDGFQAVRVNTAHPYYHKVYVPNLSKGVTIQGMDSLLWGLCVAELSTVSDATAKHFEEVRFELSRLLRKLVEDLPDPEIDTDTDD